MTTLVEPTPIKSTTPIKSPKEPKQKKNKKKSIPNQLITHKGVKKIKDPTTQGSPSDNVYFNVTIRSDPNLAATQPIYSIIRNGAVVNKASDYYLSVIRFNIPAYFTPLGSFITLPNDPQNGIYSISMTYTSDDKFEETSSIPLQFGAISSLNTYFNLNPFVTSNGSFVYYIFDYDKMIQSVNDAFKEAYTELIALVNNNNPNPLPGVNATPRPYPFMTFDGSTKLFTIWYPKVNYLDVDDQTINVYCNEYFWELFNSFAAIRIWTDVDVSPNGKDYLLYVKNNGNNLVYPDDNHREEGKDWLYFKMEQQYITLFEWNPFSKILLTTNLLPTRNESTKGSGDSFLKILTDFIPTNDVIEVRTTFQFTQQGQYRLIDLLSDAEIKNVDIDLFWEDKFGNLNKLYFQPNAVASIKIAFFNKDLFNNNHISGYVMV